jgi:hypothetical protein
VVELEFEFELVGSNRAGGEHALVVGNEWIRREIEEREGV